MSILHIEKRENPYAQISKSALWDSELSLEAVGLLARLLCRPQSWKIRICELCKSCKSSKDRIYRIINELIENGYCFRYEIRSKGRFTKFDYVIVEEKLTEDEFQKLFTQQENPEMADIESQGGERPQVKYEPFPEKPDTENQTLIIKSISNNNTNKEKNTLKSVQKKDRIDDAPPTPPKKVFHRPNVSTTEEEHTKLIASHGKDFIDECYDELSLWKEDNPTKAKQKKSDYLCIIRWVIDKVREKRIKAEELAQREKRLKFYESRSFTNSSDAISQNKEQAKLWEEHFSKMSQKMPSFYVGKKVIALQDRIEIQMREGHCVDIPYSLQKESFNEKCLNYLNSMVPKNKNGSNSNVNTPRIEQNKKDHF